MAAKKKTTKKQTTLTITFDNKQVTEDVIRQIVRENRDRLLRYESQRIDELFKSVNQLQKQVKTLQTKLNRLENKRS